MDLQTVLNALGSIASIGAIPLSIYLYLRAQEEKLASSRRDVLRTLSYQLGEGRSVTLFEIEAVTESVLRTRRLRVAAISPVEVLNDLVTETISNPMISGERKETILFELERALLLPSIRDIIARHRLSSSRLLAMVGEPIPEGADELAAESGAIAAEYEAAKRNVLTLTSTAFGVLAAVTSLAAAVFQFSEMTPRLREIVGGLPAPDLLLGVLASLLAAILVLVTERLVPSRFRDGEQRSAGRPRESDLRPTKRSEPTALDEERKRRG